MLWLRRALLAGIALCLLFIIISLAAFHLVPIEIIEARLKEEAEARAGLTVTEQSLMRTYPAGIEAEGVDMALKGKEPFIHIDNMVAWPDYMGLLSGKVRFSYAGAIENGVIKGRAGFGLLGGSQIRLEADGVPISAVPAINRFVTGLRGSFSGTAEVSMKGDGRCPSGFAEFRSDDLKGGKVSLRGIPLSVGSIGDAGLDARFSECRVDVKGLWLDGSDLSLRIDGKIKVEKPLNKSPLDLTLELVPKKPLFRGESDVLAVLRRFQGSANYFKVPVRGTLGSPALGG
ncbi:MAG: type II secretion system protein GspN [Deltaproteobacteria bacterium]|nr:type II secretion system protein GspN [Deltaproteobacteria bacterium]